MLYYHIQSFISNRLCKGILEFLWDDISPCILPKANVETIRKNILLHKLRHGLDDTMIVSMKDLKQLRSKSDTLQHQISVAKENYEDLDYTVRRKCKVEFVH